MIDSTLNPQSDKAAREQRAAERLTEWVVKKTAELEGAYIAQVDDTHHAEALLDKALDGEWDDCPLAEDDPRWLDVKRAWDKADTDWDISGAIAILEAL